MATPSASRSATTSSTAGCTGSPSARPTSPTRRSSRTPRPPPPASPTTGAPPTPSITDDERRTIAEMMAKGTYASINLATKDVDGTFERLQAGDAEVVQEPTDQPYGVRDGAFRDPAGTLIRIQESR